MKNNKNSAPSRQEVYSFIADEMASIGENANLISSFINNFYSDISSSDSKKNTLIEILVLLIEEIEYLKTELKAAGDDL